MENGRMVSVKITTSWRKLLESKVWKSLDLSQIKQRNTNEIPPKTRCLNTGD